MTARPTRGLEVGPFGAVPGRVRLPGGRPPGARIDRSTPGPESPRRLNAAAVRRDLGPVPLSERDVLLDVIDDISGSMTGANDALGLRHEALLIYLEHIAAASRRSRRGRSNWYFQCRTFDDGGTCLDIERVKIDVPMVAAMRGALLGQTYGGSSNLGPALSSSIRSAAGWYGSHVRIVMSDFELFDASVDAVLASFAAAPADVNVGIVFRATPPPGLDPALVLVRSVSQDDAPASVAMLLRDAVDCVLHQTQSGARSIGEGLE